MAELVKITYAQTFFDIALEKNMQDTLLSNFNILKQSLQENPKFIEILSSPIVPVETKTKILGDTFKQSVDELTFNCMRILVDNDRFSSIIEIIEELNAIYDKYNGNINVTVVTAIELSDELSKKLKEKLDEVTGKNVKITKVVDESIIGGIKIRLNDTEIDSTIKTKLKNLKQSILSTTI